MGCGVGQLVCLCAIVWGQAGGQAGTQYWPAGADYPGGTVTTWQPAATLAPTILPPPPVVYPSAVPVLYPPGLPAVAPQNIGGLAPPASGGTVVYRPLVPVVPMPPSYYVGRGVLGQPTLYVPGQPVRNFLRLPGPVTPTQGGGGLSAGVTSSTSSRLGEDQMPHRWFPGISTSWDG